MDAKEEINQLFQKFVDQTISPEDLERFYAYIQKPEHTPQLKWLLQELWNYNNLTEKYQSGSVSGQRSDEIQRRKRLMEAIQKTTGPEKDRIEAAIEKIKQEYYKNLASEKKEKGFWNWFKRLFVIALVIAGAGTWYYMSNRDVATATEVAYVEKVSDFGQKSTIPLPDGSLVKLNSGSKLTYPKLFEGDAREVSLEGEAFFEVAWDEQRPFVIKSGALITTVLGTSFNIRAYLDEQVTQVAVASGKVKVEKAENNPSTPDGPDRTAAAVLTANRVASYNPADSQIKVEMRESIDDLIAWREGVLKFGGVRFSEVARTLEKWYGVRVNLENEGVGNCIIFGEFKNESLQSVMKTLQYAIDIDYEFTADGLLISGKGCNALNVK